MIFQKIHPVWTGCFFQISFLLQTLCSKSNCSHLGAMTTYAHFYFHELSVWVAQQCHADHWAPLGSIWSLEGMMMDHHDSSNCHQGNRPERIIALLRRYVHSHEYCCNSEVPIFWNKISMFWDVCVKAGNQHIHDGESIVENVDCTINLMVNLNKIHQNIYKICHKNGLELI